MIEAGDHLVFLQKAIECRQAVGYIGYLPQHFQNHVDFDRFLFRQVNGRVFTDRKSLDETIPPDQRMDAGRHVADEQRIGG